MLVAEKPWRDILNRRLFTKVTLGNDCLFAKLQCSGKPLLFAAEGKAQLLKYGVCVRNGKSKEHLEVQHPTDGSVPKTKRNCGLIGFGAGVGNLKSKETIEKSCAPTLRRLIHRSQVTIAMAAISSTRPLPLPNPKSPVEFSPSLLSITNNDGANSATMATLDHKITTPLDTLLSNPIRFVKATATTKSAESQPTGKRSFSSLGYFEEGRNKERASVVCIPKARIAVSF
jgi:hypothetical protein